MDGGRLSYWGSIFELPKKDHWKCIDGEKKIVITFNIEGKERVFEGVVNGGMMSGMGWQAKKR